MIFAFLDATPNHLWLSQTGLAAWAQQSAFFGIMAWAGYVMALGVAFWIGMAAAVALALWYYPMLRTRDRMKCFFVFRHNNWLGACVFAGVAVAYMLR